MQNKWLKIALLFSLVLNITIILFVLGLKTPEPKHMQRNDRFERAQREGPPSWIRPDRGEAVKLLMQEYVGKVQEVRAQMWEKRSQLVDILREDEPDTLKIMALIEELAMHQTELEKLTARYLLDLKPNLDPEKKDIFIKIFEEGMMQHRDRRWEGVRDRPKPDSSAVRKDTSGKYEPKRPFGHQQRQDSEYMIEKMMDY